MFSDLVVSWATGCLGSSFPPSALNGVSLNRFIPTPLLQIAVASYKALATRTCRAVVETLDGIPPPGVAP